MEGKRKPTTMKDCLTRVIAVKGKEGGKAAGSRNPKALLREFCVSPQAKGTYQRNE